MPPMNRSSLTVNRLVNPSTVSCNGRLFGHISPAFLNFHPETPPKIFKWFPYNCFDVFDKG